jgi:hypothetical protein
MEPASRRPGRNGSNYLALPDDDPVTIGLGSRRQSALAQQAPNGLGILGG